MTAALAAFAVGASAESLKAEIPFTFRAANTVLPAGSYQVNVDNGSTVVIRVLNTDTKEGVITAPRYRRDVPGGAVGGAKLFFACTESNCVLTTLWNGSDGSAMVVGSPAKARKERTEARVVNLTSAKTE